MNDARYPAAYISFRVYEDSVNEVGIAKLTLPTVAYPVVQISATGTMGGIDVPIMGMLDNMELSMEYLTITDPDNYVKSMEPRKHMFDVRVAEENWEIENAEIGLWKVRHVFIARPKSFNMGDVAPITTANANATFTVYYWAGYRDNVQLWELDKRNMKCVINGKDYMAEVRKALGYS